MLLCKKVSLLKDSLSDELLDDEDVDADTLHVIFVVTSCND